MQAILIALSILSATQASSDFPDLIVAPVRVGLVPTLARPPEGLPPAQRQPGGVFLPDLLAQYTAGEVSALWRLPALSQKALDLAVESEKDACVLKLADAKAAEPTWLDRLKTGMLWGVGGVLVGGVVAALVLR